MINKLIIALFLLFTVNAYTVKDLNRVEFGKNYKMYLGNRFFIPGIGYIDSNVPVDYCTYNQSKKKVECKFAESLTYRDKYYISIPILSDNSNNRFKKGEEIYGFYMYHEQCTGCEQINDYQIAYWPKLGETGTLSYVSKDGGDNKPYQSRFEFRMNNKNGRLIRLVYDKVYVKKY